LALPTEDSVRLSLRTQQVLAHESGVTDVVDPLGGSYYIEYLTSELEKRAMQYIKKIDEMGGMTAAIEKAYIQQEIQENAFRDQRRIEDSLNKIIGVNAYCTDEECKIETFKQDKDEENKIIKSLKQLKEIRDEKLVKEKLKKLKQVADSSKSIMPVMIETVKTYATIQEICDTLREVFGEYQSSQIF
jgi:methylmalonyl-CoA mutase N-terminal domain/subunit